MYHVVTRKSESETEVKDDEADADASSAASSKKERVLHTRVPVVLERELRRFADSLRVPVSNVVRTILEDALSVADAAGDEVETRLAKAAREVGKSREKLREKLHKDPLRDVFAFQAVTLAQGAECAKCGADLPAGVAAHLGLTDSPRKPGERLFVCGDCLPRG